MRISSYVKIIFGLHNDVGWVQNLDEVSNMKLKRCTIQNHSILFTFGYQQNHSTLNSVYFRLWLFMTSFLHKDFITYSRDILSLEHSLPFPSIILWMIMMSIGTSLHQGKYCLLTHLLLINCGLFPLPVFGKNVYGHLVSHEWTTHPTTYKII